MGRRIAVVDKQFRRVALYGRSANFYRELKEQDRQ
jgi:hypothetical protein